MRFKWVPVILVLGANAAFGHEFWIAPIEYRIDADQDIKAQLRIGQKFDGAVQRYFSTQIARFEVYQDGKPIKVTGRLGDEPALNMPSLGDGLLVVVHETTDNVQTYRKENLFSNFVTHKGVGELVDLNAARGFPKLGFQEKYRRFAKSLISAGSGVGKDQPVGLRAELVALANPYTDDLTQGMPLQVLYEGEPRANAFVEVFERHGDGEVTVSTYRADTDGIAVITAEPGVEYLVDATLILPLGNEDLEAGPVWESLWAAMTFRVPAK